MAHRKKKYLTIYLRGKKEFIPQKQILFAGISFIVPQINFQVSLCDIFTAARFKWKYSLSFPFWVRFYSKEFRKYLITTQWQAKLPVFLGQLKITWKNTISCSLLTFARHSILGAAKKLHIEVFLNLCWARRKTSREQSSVRRRNGKFLNIRSRGWRIFFSFHRVVFSPRSLRRVSLFASEGIFRPDEENGDRSRTVRNEGLKLGAVVCACVRACVCLCLQAGVETWIVL